VCSQRYYLLQQMRKQGLDASFLQVVLQSIVISKVLYALPAWGGYVSREKTSVVMTKCCKKRYDMVLLARYTVLRNF